MKIVIYGAGQGVNEFKRAAVAAGHRVLGQEPGFFKRIDETVADADLVVLTGRFDHVEDAWRDTSVRLERFNSEDLEGGRALAESLGSASKEAPAPDEAVSQETF